MISSPKTAHDDIRRRILDGARLQLDRMSRDELTAVRPMLLSGEAEIINEGCRPVVIRKLPRW